MQGYAFREIAVGGASEGVPSTDPTAVANTAAAAFWNWKSLSSSDRVEMLKAMASAIDDARGVLAEAAADEVGIARGWSDFNVDIAKSILLQATDIVPHMGDIENRETDGIRSIMRRDPVGVVLGFAPWNAPVALAVRALAAPLACGNSVVLKGSEHCPETHRLTVDVLCNAGLPEGVANVVTNKPDESEAVTRALIAHPAVRRVNFTGSTRVGRHVAAIAAEHLKRCLLELSGKAPLIVLDDADLDKAADAAIFGAFFNQGQVCMSTERIIVLGSVADEFVERLIVRAAQLRAGDPREENAPLGSLLNAEAALRVRGLIEDAVSRGAKLLIGGEISGAIMQPAIVDRVAANMRLYHEESFGPVASVLRVSDEEDAISIANDTEFGLSSAVFTRDEARGMRVADRLETGMCHINGSTVFDDPYMPFGGMKSSGYGRFGGLSSLDEFTELRWIARHDGPVPNIYDSAH